MPELQQLPFVKVQRLEMAKIAQILQRKFKISHFLFRFRNKRLFCRYWSVTCVYRISYLYVKHSTRGTSLKFRRWRYQAILPHLILKPILDVHFFTTSDACAKFHEFLSMFMPSKKRFICQKRKNNNKKRSNSNRVLTPSVIGL